MSPSDGDIRKIITEESSSEMSNHPPEVTPLPGTPPRPALSGCFHPHSWNLLLVTIVFQDPRKTRRRDLLSTKAWEEEKVKKW